MGMFGAVQITIAGARMPMTKQTTDTVVSAKITARVAKLRSIAITVDDVKAG